MFEWLSWASGQQLVQYVSDEQLQHISTALANRTFLAGGSRLSLADLVLYGLVHPAVVSSDKLSKGFTS